MSSVPSIFDEKKTAGRVGDQHAERR